MMEVHKPEAGRESEPPIQSNYEQPPAPFEQVTQLQNESRADSLIELTPSLLRRGISEIIGSLYQTTSSSNKGSPPQAAGYFRREPTGGFRVASGSPGLAS